MTPSAHSRATAPATPNAPNAPYAPNAPSASPGAPVLQRPPEAPPLILDTTLREGEQTPGVVFSLEDKLHIARLVDRFGVDVIEAGHPAVSDAVRRGVHAIAHEGLNASVLAHSRALPADIDLARACDVEWVGLFFSVRDAALEQRFRRDVDAAERLVVDAVQYAVDHGLKVRYTPEDTVRSNFQTVVRIANAAVDAGANRISIADTTGAMTPTRMAAFVTALRQSVPAPLNVHCHDDLGLAVANSLAAWESGATLVDTCVNGLGERCGITDLASLTGTLETVYGHNRWDLTLLPELCDFVAQASGIPIHAQAPLVGEHAFSHNAGLHVAAVLMDPSHYENIPAARLGRQRTLVLDRFAGLATIRHRLERIGLTATDDVVRAVRDRLKAEEARLVDDEGLRRIHEAVAPTLTVGQGPTA